MSVLHSVHKDIFTQNMRFTPLHLPAGANVVHTGVRELEFKPSHLVGQLITVLERRQLGVLVVSAQRLLSFDLAGRVVSILVVVVDGSVVVLVVACSVVCRLEP